MRNYSAILVALITLGCVSPSDDEVTARIESFGGYAVLGGMPSLSDPADRIPCTLDSRLGTHFSLSSPGDEPRRVTIVTGWTRVAFEGSTQPESLGREVRTIDLDSHDEGPGTFLLLKLNDESDLFPARYQQVVTTGSGRVLFQHDFVVPDCSSSS